MKNFIFILATIMSFELTLLCNQSNEFPYIQPLSVEVINEERSQVLDEDKDGIKDSLDKCPTTPLGVKVDISGCKLLLDNDSDNDGVSNKNDKCPKSESNALVDFNGCEPDDDKDGVVNVKDKCPNTSKEFLVDAVGCPQTTILNVTFQSARSTLSPKDFPNIKKFADFLQNNTNYQAIIYGHTDTTDKANNMQLSRDRARAVMRVLIKYGVKLTRLTAIGMGSKKPIADNKTIQGRAKNRRIEIELLQ